MLLETEVGIEVIQYVTVLLRVTGMLILRDAVLMRTTPDPDLMGKPTVMVRGRLLTVLYLALKEALPVCCQCSKAPY